MSNNDEDGHWEGDFWVSDRPCHRGHLPPFLVACVLIALVVPGFMGRGVGM
jgi:hypothetical protein